MPHRRSCMPMSTPLKPAPSTPTAASPAIAWSIGRGALRPTGALAAQSADRVHGGEHQGAREVGGGMAAVADGEVHAGVAVAVVPPVLHPAAEAVAMGAAELVHVEVTAGPPCLGPGDEEPQ